MRFTASINWERTGPYRVPKEGERVAVTFMTTWPAGAPRSAISTTNLGGYGTVRRIYRHIRRLCIEVGESHYLVPIPEDAVFDDILDKSDDMRLGS